MLGDIVRISQTEFFLQEVDVKPGTSGEGAVADLSGGAPDSDEDVIILELDQEGDDRASGVSGAGFHRPGPRKIKTADLSSFGLVDVSSETKHQRSSLARIKHNRYGRPLSSMVCVFLYLFEFTLFVSFFVVQSFLLGVFISSFYCRKLLLCPCISGRQGWHVHSSSRADSPRSV